MQTTVPVTPERYVWVMALFHTLLLLACWRLVRCWTDAGRCRSAGGAWLRALAVDLGWLAAVAYLISLLVTVGANADQLPGLELGSISSRLLGQALFGEAILLGVAFAVLHWRAEHRRRAVAFGVAAVALLAVYVDAYRVEPRQLKVRRHLLDRTYGAPEATVLRILHLTDIQTPVIGAREERALRTGLQYRPDLIVLTGDYVQDALGRPTEERAAADLRALIGRVGFEAPLGVFATDGDAGPPCRDVFAGTRVRCLVDESALVRLPDGDSLVLTGLSRFQGRARDSAWLAQLQQQGPQGRRRIFISHAPDFVDALPDRPDLVLAGHTHGGQVVLPFFGPLVTATRLPRRYAGDLNDFRGTPLHVSRGVGMERGFAPPVRFLCPPEICILDVRLPSGQAGQTARVARSR